MSNPLDINNNQDVIGVDIHGNGNIIGKDISVVINELSDDCGITLLHPNHFNETLTQMKIFNNGKKRDTPFR